ncbi:hypothetical protein GGF46_005080 [Coemansia sp. RSA 552]|nr:hypothetical protein GGF46_005080 [Coemansia sp. RSA 552]
MDPGKLLSLFRYLLGHHRVDSAEFRKHILARTVVAYLRQAHFVGLGFFRLEREFIKLVTKDRFTTEYLNTTIPRFWALHMFLRRKRYVPRLKLYGRQIHIHKNALYRLLPTLIPKRSEMETLSDNDRCIELVIDHDIASAIHTFLHAAPRSAPGSRGSSVDWMIQYKARMVYPDEPSSIKAQ